MKFKLFAVFILIFLFSCQDDELREKNLENDLGEIVIDENAYLKGCIRIRLKASAEPQLQLTSVNGKAQTGFTQLDELAVRLGASRIERLFPYAGKFEARTRKEGLHLWYNVYFDEDIPTTRAISDFSDIPEIDYVEPIRKIIRVGGTDKIVYAKTQQAIAVASSSAMNDPLLTDQWHYQNDGSLAYSKRGADINLFKAWEVTHGSREVIVAIVDGGIDVDHEDLAANMWINTAEKNGTTGRDDDGNGYKDDIYGWNFVDYSATIVAHSHGTHVAGTVAAVNNNGKGVCGIAGGSGNGDGVRLMSCQIFKPNPNDPSKDMGTGLLPAAIKYGADNGAVISQNSWGFENGGSDASTRAAIDYFIKYAGIDENGNQVGPMKGGIVIFAAGNEDMDYMAYPGAYDEVLSVAAMAPDYIKAWYSNFANWVDVTAPGGTQGLGYKYTDKCMVLSTLPDNKYGYMQGTSMACPHVSGIAALAVSAKGGPGFTPEALRKMLLEGTKDIDTYNPAYKGKMGAGYIDASMVLGGGSGIPPQSVEDLKASWKAFSVDLNWVVPVDEDDEKPASFEIYWSTSSLSGVNLNTISIKQRQSVDIGDKNAGDIMEATVSGLEIGKTYYIAVVAIDSWGNTSGAAYVSGMTVNNPPQVIKNLENLYFGKLGTLHQVTLADYFEDMDGEKLKYEVEVNQKGVVKTEISNEGVLTITALKYGTVEVTVSASDSQTSCSSTFALTSRDDSREIDLYPNPVKDKLHIRMGEKINGNIKVNIYNTAGALVMKENTIITPFAPVEIDMSKLSGGAYLVVVNYAGKEIKNNIIKL